MENTYKKGSVVLMILKRILSVLVCTATVCALFTGCGGKSAEFTIGLSQISDHPSLNTIRESFTAEMERLGYGPDRVSINYKNAQGDQSNLNSISQTFVGDQVDLIVAIATPTAQSAAAAAENSGIPVLFSAVTDPVAAKLVQDGQNPGGTITGTSDAIPVESIFGLAAQLTPNAKTFGFVYNLGEANSVSVINDAKAYCDQNGLTYKESTVTNSSEVQQAAQSLVGSVDAFFTPIDNTVAEAMPVFAEVAINAGLPIYPGADSMVIDGGFATVGIDYTVLGQKTAEMAIAILEGGDPATMPVVTLDNFRGIINKETADALNIDISGVTDMEVYTGGEE